MFQLYKNKISGYKFINFFDYETPWFIDLICESKRDRDNLKDLLEREDILTRESYPALSKQSFLQSVEKTSLKFSENISENILWLPSSTNLTKNQIEQVSDKIEISDLAKGF